MTVPPLTLLRGSPMTLKKLRRRREREARSGISLLEAVIACAILVVCLGAVGLILLRNIDESRQSGALNDINAISLAIKSADLSGDLIDTNRDGDYFDDLMQKQYLTKVPSILPGASYRVLGSLTDSGVVVYYVSVECSGDSCLRVVKALDQKIDLGDGPSAGQIQWIE